MRLRNLVVPFLAVLAVAAIGGPGVKADNIANYDVKAIGTCSTFPCGSPISISGTFTVDLTTGIVASGTMTMSDSADLATPSLSFPFNLQGPFSSDEFLFFRQPSGIGTISYVLLIFPFGSFPSNYSGGPLCTDVVPGCGVKSGAGIGPTDESPSLLAQTTTGDNIIITSGSVVEASEPSIGLLLSIGLSIFVSLSFRRNFDHQRSHPL